MAYSSRDAALACGLSPRTIENLVYAGELRSRRIGGRRLILRADLLRYLAADHAKVRGSGCGRGQRTAAAENGQ
ncbi:MAG: helix-turn-helix domain-containing protein [Terriglobales bacterium]